jgi:hypothetical protein
MTEDADMDDFRLIQISAGFEHGGNVVHRHLDGHPGLYVYPFESQLGNRSFCDFLSSVERVQYRYPEFPEGLSSRELYEQIVDEEMKTFLRKRNGSKFKDADLELSEGDRISEFEKILGSAPFTRRGVIEAFFRSTFLAWRNYYAVAQSGMRYVGYSPAIGIDADRIVRDFPDVRIIHIVRNPFSAYRDTKRRPFPQPLSRYLITWNIFHSTVEMYARKYPSNVRVFLYEEFVEDKVKFMQEIAQFADIDYVETMLYPSWNGVELKDNIAPWGTVLQSTRSYNKQMLEELAACEKEQIACGTAALARHFGYQQIDYLKEYY